MTYKEAESMKACRCGNPERGFSIVELLVVTAIMVILSAMAVIEFGPNMQAARADTALRQVIDQLRQAREYSIANRRYVQVTFPTIGQSEILITQLNSLTTGAAPVNPILSTLPIQLPMQFYVFAAVSDTPDGYGHAAAIEFEGQNGGPVGGMFFQSDGELVDGATYLPINGTVFLGVPGTTATARAVTVMGTTGRVRGWKGSGASWFQF